MTHHDQMIHDAIDGKIFAFIGQRATTGEPHPITGRMSTFGSYYSFETRKEAQEFVDSKMGDINVAYAEVGTWRTLRKFSLGQSVANYKEHLASLDW